MDLGYTVSGFLVGTIVGLTGVGGGSLMTPILVLLFGVAPATAVGTDLLYAALTKGSGTLVHGLRGNVDWRVTGRLAAGSIPATAATLILLSRLGVDGHTGSALISTGLGVALLLTAVALLFRRRLQQIAHRPGGALAVLAAPGRTLAVTVVFGALLGVLVTISSVGAGALGVTVLILLYPNLPITRVVGSDIAHAVPLTLLAGLGHWLIGSVNGTMLAALLLGSMPGIVLGSHFAGRVPEKLIRILLAAVLLVVGGRLVIV
ncbi:MAG TPA: sulfite exporter TauE/SafE family protein [Rhodocyclaceae bacterium]|nr:sulfite exporter TauE/SafE family protein [Rhodocyclaceae bacterium]